MVPFNQNKGAVIDRIVITLAVNNNSVIFSYIREALIITSGMNSALKLYQAKSYIFGQLKGYPVVITFFIKRNLISK